MSGNPRKMDSDDLVDATETIKRTYAALMHAVKALEEAKERVYDVYNTLSDGGWLIPEANEDLLQAVGKRSQNKLSKIAYQCWEWGSDLTQMIERLDETPKGGQ